MKIIILFFTALIFTALGALANTYGHIDAEINKSAVNNVADNSEDRNMPDESQQIRITGTVTDQNGGPLPGVTVLVKGTTIGTLTDASGKYTLSNVPANSTLIFSFVGMTTQEIPTAGRILIDIVMKEEAIGLEEVIVIGYGTQKKVNLTGAVSNVDSRVLESRPIANVGQGLQGAISNLNITQNNGALGAEPSFNIRGNTSITGGSPLILINGIPMDINMINPSDIDNVTVLKDAASAAIYGARAAYGVILVTTKSGKQADKPKVSLSMNYAINTPTRQFKTLDVLERMNFMNTANLRQSGSFYYQFDEYYQAAILAHYNDPTKPEVFQHPNSAPNIWSFCANTDWAAETMRDSYPQSQYTASVSGGSDRFNYYTSFSYYYEEGDAKHFDEKYQRYNFMTNLSYDVTKWLNIGTKISINSSKKDYPAGTKSDGTPESQLNFATTLWANWPVYFPDGNFAFAGAVANLVATQVIGGYRWKKNDDYWMTGTARLTPIKNMTFNIDYSFNVEDQEALDYRRKMAIYDKNGNTYGWHPGHNPDAVNRENIDNRYYALNAFADYENTFGDKHYFKAMAGYNQEYDHNSSFEAERQNLMISTLPYVKLAYGERIVTDSESHYAIRGVFSRVNYSFDDRYLFEFNGRYDGTSKFPKTDRFAFFPSASVGWRIDNEGFFSGMKSRINLLKLRASYGSLGNQAVAGYYPYIASYSSGTVAYLMGGEAPMTVYAPGLVSPTLTWETVTQQDIGVDFALFNSKLSGSFDYYKRNTLDMLTASTILPSVLSVSEPQANSADMETYGWDATLDWKHSIGKVRYGLSLILSDYQSEITEYSNPSGLISSYYKGYKMGQIWGLTTGGLFQTDEEALALDQKNISGRVRKAGDIWFVDLDGDGKITRGKQTLDDHGDMSIIGNSTPRYSYGIRPNAQWNGFDLEIFLQGIGKKDVNLATTYWTGSWSGEWGAQHKIIADWWTPDNRDAYFPTPIFSNGADVTAVQTRFLQNGAYLRLKQLTFGYTLPGRWINKLEISRIRAYFSGQNLWERTKMIKMVDPEQTSATLYPLKRSYSMGINIDF